MQSYSLYVSILLFELLASCPNHKSHRIFFFNEFVTNAFHDNMGFQKISFQPKMRPFFSFTYQKCRVRVNDFDFCFVKFGHSEKATKI